MDNQQALDTAIFTSPSTYPASQTSEGHKTPTAPHCLKVIVSITSNGWNAASTEWNGLTFRATSPNGAIFALCRALVGAGCPNLKWEVPRRISGKVHNAALFTVDDRGFRRWRPSPAGRLRGEAAE